MKIVAAMELARRKELEFASKKRVCSSMDAAEIFRSKIRDLNHEEIWCLFLNRNNNIIIVKRMASGGVSQCAIDSITILKEAILLNATGVIIAHNHPSCSIKPSNDDNNLTRNLYKAFQAVDIRLTDHLIIGGEAYYSYADNGMLYA